MKYLISISISLFILLNFVEAQKLYEDFEKVSTMEDLSYPYAVSKAKLSNNITIAYMDEGKGEDVILFIHGLGSYAPAWKKNIEGLKQNYRCIAIDLPGYGKSSKGDYSGSMSFFADVIIEFAEALNLSKFTLAGHSMGGQISIVTALKYPDLVKNLILVAPAGIETFTEGEKEWFRNAITARSVMLTPLEAIESNFGYNFYRMPDEAFFMVKDRYAMTGAGEEFEWYCNIIPKCVQGMVNEPVIRDLGKLTQPTLVIFGEGDQLIPNRFLHGHSTAKVAEAADQLIPNSKMVLVPKSGHFVMFEKSSEVNQEISSFL
jgi:pimeloyl-ACP methyl ester carboxylesterase